MSYVYTYLPELEELKKIIEKDPNRLKYYSKYGAFMGPTESVEYLNKKIEEYYESKINK